MTEQKIEAFWRDATAGDVAKVMRGEKVEARFRDDTFDKWAVALLGGYGAMSEGFNWINIDGDCYAQCQVYEPQQWWLDKPDPGEGYRLLEKFPPEELQSGFDQVYHVECQSWLGVATISSEQAETDWYRRRIEPVKQDAGSTCASTIPKGWIKLQDDEPRLASDAFWSVGAKDWIIIGDARLESANRDKWPAIRQVEAHKSLQLVAGYQYRLPGGASIIATKQGFEVL